MRLKATVNKITGKAKHYSGDWIGDVPVRLAPLPRPAWVEITQEQNAFFLLYFDANGVFITDSWHQTLDEAMEQAEFEFEITKNDWLDIENQT